MHKCTTCGTEFEGKFCPECGTKWEEKRICPQCGSVLPANAKFCSECGAKWESGEEAPPTLPSPLGEGGGEEPTPLPPIAEKGSGNHMVAFPESPKEGSSEGAMAKQTRKQAAFFTENLLKLFYRLSAIVPIALCGLFSLLTFLFCLAPAANMNDVFFGTGSASMGSVYDLGDASSSSVLAFAAIGLAVCAVGFVFLFVKPLAWRNIPQTKLPVSDAAPWLFQAVWLGAFASACAICADVNKTDGGMGVFSVGAGPILIIVFALLFGLLAAGIQILRIVLAKKFPALAEEENERREALKARYAKPASETPAFSAEQSEMLARARMVVRLPLILYTFFPAFITLGTVTTIILMGGLGASGMTSNIMMLVLAVMCLPLLVRTLWAIFSKKALTTKVLFKKDELPPEQFFAKNRKKAIATFIGSIIFALIGLVPMIVPAAVQLARDGVSSVSHSALQIFGTEAYLGICVAVVVGLLMFTGFTVLAVLAAKNAIYCKKFAEGTERYPEYTEAPKQFLRDLPFAPLPVPVRHARGGWLTGAVVCVLVAAIAIGAMAGTNIFSEGKLDKIEMGASQYRVMDVLGSTRFEEPGEWDYISDNAVSLIERQQELETELVAALAEGDTERIEALTAESEKLAEEAKTMKYRTIRVVFDADEKVSRIEMFKGDRSKVLEGSKSRSAAKAGLSPARVPLADLMTGTAEITYSVKFDGGSYVRTRLGAAEVFSDEYHNDPTSIDKAGTYYLKWTDSFGECTAVLQVT